MTDILMMLAVWRISHLLVFEAAPFELLSKFRRLIGVKYDARSQAYSDSEIGKLFTCVWCLSVWVGWLAAALHYQDLRALWIGLAYSAGAVLIESMVRRGG